MTETEAKWSERVREWKASGQTAREFAASRDFKPTTLVYWARGVGVVSCSVTHRRLTDFRAWPTSRTAVGEVAMDRGWRQWTEEDARGALAELSSTRESVTEF